LQDFFILLFVFVWDVLCLFVCVVVKFHFAVHLVRSQHGSCTNYRRCDAGYAGARHRGAARRRVRPACRAHGVKHAALVESHDVLGAIAGKFFTDRGCACTVWSSSKALRDIGCARQRGRFQGTGSTRGLCGQEDETPTVDKCGLHTITP